MCDSKIFARYRCSDPVAGSCVCDVNGPYATKELCERSWQCNLTNFGHHAHVHVQSGDDASSKTSTESMDHKKTHKTPMTQQQMSSQHPALGVQQGSNPARLSTSSYMRVTQPIHYLQQ